MKDKRHPDGLSGKQIKQRTYKFKCGSTRLCIIHSFIQCAFSTSSYWLGVEVSLHDNRGGRQTSRQSDERLPGRRPSHRVSGGGSTAGFKSGRGLSFKKNPPGSYERDGGGYGIGRVKI